MPTEYGIEVLHLNELVARLDAVADGILSVEVMNVIGNYLVASMLIRTQKGKDVSGQNFDPYSAKYKLFRHELELPHNKVDLFLTGSMLSSMTYTATKDKVTIFFQNTEDIKGVKNPAKAFWNNQTRNFFGIDAKQRKKVISIINNHIRGL